MKTHILVALVALGFLGGCTAIPSNTDAVTIAERTTQLANDTFNAFLKVEYQNQAYVKQYVPQIHEFANYLRQPQNARKWLKDARDVTKLYKQNRTPELGAQLQSYLDVLTEAMTKARTYTSQIATKGP